MQTFGGSMKKILQKLMYIASLGIVVLLLFALVWAGDETAQTQGEEVEPPKEVQNSETESRTELDGEGAAESGAQEPQAAGDHIQKPQPPKEDTTILFGGDVLFIYKSRSRQRKIRRFFLAVTYCLETLFWQATMQTGLPV